jgi:phage gp36-like protein
MIEVIEDQLRPKEEAIENLTETLTETAEDEDLLAKALREKAKVEMDDYLKSREDDQEVAN